MPYRACGAPPTWEQTHQVREHIHEIIGRVIERGHADGTIAWAVSPHDIIAFGSMLAQPHPADPAWDATCRRLLATYLAGLSVSPIR